MRLAWFVSGWQVPLFSDRNNLLHNIQTQHFVRGKGWQEMRWSDGGMVGEHVGVLRMECWLTVGRADRGLGPEWMWGWNAVAMGTVKWRWEARWNNFIVYLTVHIYKHNNVHTFLFQIQSWWLCRAKIVQCAVALRAMQGNFRQMEWDPPSTWMYKEATCVFPFSRNGSILVA